MTRTWLEVLRAEVSASSLAVVADKLGISRTAVSQLCNEKYPGDMERMQMLVEGAFMGHTVSCPILGDIPLHQCLAHQRKPAGQVGDNPTQIKLWKACRSGCPHSRLDDSERLRQPMRLVVADRPVTVQEYDAIAAIRRLERQASSDAGPTGNTLRILNDLLKSELEALGVRYNRRIKQCNRNGGCNK
jgi:transcriptional regulator with XRE-family HTH domain